MRSVSLFASIALALLTSIRSPVAAEELVLDAAAPYVSVTVKGERLRLRAEPRLPEVVLLNPGAAARVKPRQFPFAQVTVEVDSASLAGRLGRPTFSFDNGEQRSLLAAWFSLDAVEGADGLIGPGGLPYERVTFRLKEGEGRNEIVLAMRAADDWIARGDWQGYAFDVRFDLLREETVLSRGLAGALTDGRMLRPQGEVGRVPIIFGLRAAVQPATGEPNVALAGLPLGRALIRTDEPILPPDGAEDLIVVTAEGDEDRERAVFGRTALAGCTSLSVSQRTKTATLLCD